MTTNLFDYFEEVPGDAGTHAPWAARAPRRTNASFDIKLVPRTPNWQNDPESLSALERLQDEPWVAMLTRTGDGVELRLSDSWIETTGAALEAGGGAEAALVNLARAQRYAAGGFAEEGIDEREDSLTRELRMQNDAADELLKRVMSGESEALELWFKTRAWVISGQRKTLARLGVAFDRVFFESDFLEEGNELVERGLREGKLERRLDGVVIYDTGVEHMEEMPLVRADGQTTQHMRAVSYWMGTPSVQGVTTIQITGTEWVAHSTCIRQLMGELSEENPRTPNPLCSRAPWPGGRERAGQTDRPYDTGIHGPRRRARSISYPHFTAHGYRIRHNSTQPTLGRERRCYTYILPHSR